MGEVIKGIKRAVIIVIDSLGIGELPDAAEYNDAGSHTLDNLSEAVGGLGLENLASFGLGLIEGVTSIKRVATPIASYGRMKEVSCGKDTSTGHWEMAGLVTEKPMATFPDGFPRDIMNKFTEETGYGWLHGKPASGTEIIKELGEEHLTTGKPIVYTSVDSVFQIAAHEDIIPVEELYRVCIVTRRFLNEYNVGRVIARPFTGRPGGFKRSERRKDFSVEPPGATLLDRLKKKGLSVTAVGKIGDIFGHRGFTEEIETKSNMEVMDKTMEAIKKGREGLIFANLVDFDMLYGHRNDSQGYARALMAVDRRLPEISVELTGDDILIITADHGCDPTTPSTDHSREYVPLLVYGTGLKRGVDLGTRETFADVGQTLAEVFGVGPLPAGTSFLGSILPV
jgi:phosphopentomutase